MSETVSVTCIGGIHDGREMFMNRQVLLHVRELEASIPIYGADGDPDLGGRYSVPKDDPLRLEYVGPI